MHVTIDQVQFRTGWCGACGQEPRLLRMFYVRGNWLCLSCISNDRWFGGLDKPMRAAIANSYARAAVEIKRRQDEAGLEGWLKRSFGPTRWAALERKVAA